MYVNYKIYYVNVESLEILIINKVNHFNKINNILIRSFHCNYFIFITKLRLGRKY